MSLSPSFLLSDPPAAASTSCSFGASSYSLGCCCAVGQTILFVWLAVGRRPSSHQHVYSSPSHVIIYRSLESNIQMKLDCSCCWTYWMKCYYYFHEIDDEIIIIIIKENGFITSGSLFHHCIAPDLLHLDRWVDALYANISFFFASIFPSPNSCCCSSL